MSPCLFLSPAFHSMEKELRVWMEAESRLDGSGDGGAMGTRRVPREGLWEIGKAVKCLEAICQSDVSFFPEVYNLLNQCYHLVEAIPPQKQVLHKGTELTASVGYDNASILLLFFSFMLLHSSFETVSWLQKGPFSNVYRFEAKISQISRSSPEKPISMERYYWTMGRETWAPWLAYLHEAIKP
ncbi:hypothetical protein JHK82_044934 [Glycine max]|nr:hypothetical protein JHK82_044934 [Glycine max]